MLRSLLLFFSSPITYTLTPSPADLYVPSKLRQVLIAFKRDYLLWTHLHMFRTLGILLIVLVVAGCQTGLSSAELETTTENFENSKSTFLLPDSAFSTLSAAEWMAKRDMPLVLDQPMSASEVSYVLRKTGFEPSPAEVTPWIGQNRSSLIGDLIEGLDASPFIDFPEAFSITIFLNKLPCVFVP